MRMDEVSGTTTPDTGRLVGLVQWLAGRADDTSAEKRIGKDTFLNMARQLGISITADNLQDMLDQPPLNSLFEPLDPQSRYLVYRGGESTPTAMPVNKAQDIVGKMAKRANPLA